MLLNNQHVDRISRALDASVLRQSVISNNIANIDVPYYKRSEVKFEQYLKQELQTTKSTFVGNRTDPRHIQIGGSTNVKPIRASIGVDQTTSMNNNYNNVDIDSEMSLMAKNQLYYSTLVQQMNHEFKMTRTAIDGRG
jgi:flagellar basal-body rod protein FlgB